MSTQPMDRHVPRVTARVWDGTHVRETPSPLRGGHRDPMWHLGAEGSTRTLCGVPITRPDINATGWTPVGRHCQRCRTLRGPLPWDVAS